VLSSEAKAPPPPVVTEQPAQKPPRTKRSRKRE
jgi:hypothetical protein